jgi:hypothetical protein
MAIDFPSSPTVGTQFAALNGAVYLYDNNSSWTTLGDTQTSNPFVNAFKFRSIYTRGYVIGGYKDATPWRNANRTQHATDVTTNLGDQLDQNCAYVDASYSDYYLYIYATSPTWPGVGTYTSSYNMITESGRTHQSAWNTTQDQGNYGDSGVIINSNLTMAWILCTSNIVDKHNLATEVMYAAGSGGANVGTAGDWVCAWYGEFYGWVKQSSSGNRNHKIEFSTETWSAAGLTVGTDGWGKALKTKEGYAYVKNFGNISASAYKINDSTGVNIRTDLSFNNAGEENYQTGQNWGYCLGEYNGAQNNNTYKVTHGTDAYTVLGSSSQPKGHDGVSSAGMASGSAMFLGGL